jgi:2-polyprenyl-6-methoxyphenol hydroxylase-like FAD-dependent oxidoreductase
MDRIGKEPKKLNIGVVGYGPAGIIAAIGLSKQGHQVTIFEKDFYDWKTRELKNSDKDYMYPMVLG